MPRRQWRFRVQDILDAVRQIQAYTDGLDLDALAASPIALDAVLYRIAVIGEAARAIPAEVKQRHHEDQSMRNRLIHEYLGVRVATVWQTVQEDLPSLAVQLAALLDRSDA